MGKKGLTVGAKAPDFQLESTRGTINLTDYLGRPLVILFFRGTWCPNCRKQLEVIQQHVQRFTDKGISIIGIAGQKLENLKQYAEANQVPFPLLSDTSREVMKAYEVFTLLKWDSYRIAVPSTYVLDGNQEIRYVYIGSSQFDRPRVDEIISQATRLVE